VGENGVEWLASEESVQAKCTREDGQRPQFLSMRERRQLRVALTVEGFADCNDAILVTEGIEAARELEREQFRAASMTLSDDLKDPHRPIVPDRIRQCQERGDT
jgi:hypothetical protein